MRNVIIIIFIILLMPIYGFCQNRNEHEYHKGLQQISEISHQLIDVTDVKTNKKVLKRLLKTINRFNNNDLRFMQGKYGLFDTINHDWIFFSTLMHLDSLKEMNAVLYLTDFGDWYDYDCEAGEALTGMLLHSLKRNPNNFGEAIKYLSYEQRMALYSTIRCCWEPPKTYHYSKNLWTEIKIAFDIEE